MRAQFVNGVKTDGTEIDARFQTVAISLPILRKLLITPELVFAARGAKLQEFSQSGGLKQKPPIWK